MNLFANIETASIQIITPELAARLLKTSPGNRALRKSNVAALTAAIRAGTWRVTSQGIGINKRGQLRDGHHRLTACVEAASPSSA